MLESLREALPLCSHTPMLYSHEPSQPWPWGHLWLTGSAVRMWDGNKQRQAGTHRICLHLSIVESRYNGCSSSHLPKLVKVLLTNPYLVHMRGLWQGVSQLSQPVPIQTTTLTFNLSITSLDRGHCEHRMYFFPFNSCLYLWWMIENLNKYKYW